MASCSSVEISAWVKIGDGATIDWVCNEGEVEFSVGGHDGFVLATSELGLHNLVDRAQEALREVQRGRPQRRGLPDGVIRCGAGAASSSYRQVCGLVCAHD